MRHPDDLKYSTEHEWVRVEDGVGVVGITDYAQDTLSDIVFVELPEVGARVTQFEKFGEIESVKSVSELYAPVSGDVIERNEELFDHPELVNAEPYGLGWLIRVRLADLDELANLLDAPAYRHHAGVMT
ncbi:MAG TPA: glycine cleavage system protein GcvH [Dehalococcoidia bacterium]|nr:glycine cleavage system protein GcvH [Dehalococcoidia bacterium]